MNLSAQDLVRTLNELFGRFDRLADVSVLIRKNSTVYIPANFLQVMVFISLISCLFLMAGAQLPADKDPGGLLLLCVGGPWATKSPCPALCGDGPGYDQHHTVSPRFLIILALWNYAAQFNYVCWEGRKWDSRLLYPTQPQVREEAAELWHGHEDRDPLGLRTVWGAGTAEVAVWRLVVGRGHSQHAGGWRYTWVSRPCKHSSTCNPSKLYDVFLESLNCSCHLLALNPAASEPGPVSSGIPTGSQALKLLLSSYSGLFFIIFYSERWDCSFLWNGFHEFYTALLLHFITTHLFKRTFWYTWGCIIVIYSTIVFLSC